MDAEVDKGKMPGGSTYLLGCRGGRLAAFRLFWTSWQNRWRKSASFLNRWRKTVR